MSFSTAQDLIRLARLAASRRHGIGLDEICDEFGISHRTAQRMTDTLETAFMNVEAEDGDVVLCDGRVLFFELKSEKGRLSPTQEAFRDAVLSQGFG